MIGRWSVAGALVGVLAGAFDGSPALAADTENGRRVYALHCASCHGASGVPVMPGATDFTRMETLLQPDPVLMLKIKAGKSAMPGYAGLLKDREIMDVIAFLRTLR